MAVREEESITSFGKNPQKSDVYDEDERTVGATSGESGRVYGKLVLLGLVFDFLILTCFLHKCKRSELEHTKGKGRTFNFVN